MLTTQVQNGLGVGPANLADGNAYVRGQDFSVGMVGQFDLANTDSNVTNNIPGHPASGFSNLIVPASPANQGGILAVMKTATAQNTKGQFRSLGEAYVLVVKASGSVAKGDALCVVASHTYLSPSTAAGDRYVAIALEAATTPTTPTLVRCLIDMVNGFGTVAA